MTEQPRDPAPTDIEATRMYLTVIRVALNAVRRHAKEPDEQNLLRAALDALDHLTHREINTCCHCAVRDTLHLWIDRHGEGYLNTLRRRGWREGEPGAMPRSAGLAFPLISGIGRAIGEIIYAVEAESKSDGAFARTALTALMEAIYVGSHETVLASPIDAEPDVVFTEAPDTTRH